MKLIIKIHGNVSLKTFRKIYQKGQEPRLYTDTKQEHYNNEINQEKISEGNRV